MYHADDANEFGVTRFAEVDWHPHYNVATNQIVETIITVHGEKRLGHMRWGFVSLTAKEPKLAPINARAETLPTSPMFRDAFRRHRCLVVADGFCEWRKTTDVRGRHSSSDSSRGGPWASQEYGR